jgi:spore coat protein U-like protein
MNKFTTPLLHAAIAAALMLGAASTSYAVPATGTLSVTANVVAACNVSTSDALNFGSSINNLSGAAVDGAGALHIQCTTGSTPSVALDQGQNDDSGTRRMKTTAGDYLAYVLYSDENRTTVWGAGDDSFSFTPNGSDQIIPVYGRITAEQNAAPVGNYADSVAVTVTF